MNILISIAFLYGASVAQAQNNQQPPQQNIGSQTQAAQAAQGQVPGKQQGKPGKGGKNYPDPSWQPKPGQEAQGGAGGPPPKGGAEKPPQGH